MARMIDFEECCLFTPPTPPTQAEPGSSLPITAAIAAGADSSAPGVSLGEELNSTKI
jgi:hypothetical protein